MNEDFVELDVVVTGSSRPDYGLRITDEFGKVLWNGTPGMKGKFRLPPNVKVDAVKFENL